MGVTQDVMSHFFACEVRAGAEPPHIIHVSLLCTLSTRTVCIVTDIKSSMVTLGGGGGFGMSSLGLCGRLHIIVAALS